ncbi:uroporphyrinogen-III synthase [Arsenicitalea aurantiaca]|uniref:uroporphyrinogen-III synthase n=1 Tax=Arsenicitalea aurantiaca TaxID=1783274 RepID=UPI0013157A0C|nr:uroporphyrinogen-III synthase [Arsenicitalea aurantiaca]
MTRPQPDASETAARLGALGIVADVSPLLFHRTLLTSLPDPRGFAGVALTSANAIRALMERDVLEGWRQVEVFAVGTRTAAAARQAGFARVRIARGTLGDLVEMLSHAQLGGPVFYPAATHQSGDLAKSLAPFGVMVVTARVYEMAAATALEAPVLESLESGALGAALFYSRRTAETFVALTGQALSDEARKRLGVLCISEGVAEPLVERHFVRVGLADHPSEEGMMALALSFARDQNAP